MTFEKTITPAFETIGRRKRMTGVVGQITDESGLLLHSYEYSNYSQAETALNAIVYDLLMDYCERGLIDTPPSDPLPSDGPGDPIPGDEDYEYHVISASPFCAEPDNLCSVHNPCPAHAADAARFLAQRSLSTWQPAEILVDNLPF